jgi:pathogenesis-related protein 1
MLPKASHILLLWLVAMRPFLTLVAMVVSCSAQAQSPYSHGPYTPRDQPYGGQYAPPAMLDGHNAIRARVGVPPLVWSDQLAQVAQDWANHLIATGGLLHRPNNRHGENIYTISGRTTSPAQVVGYWAGEARGYDVRSNTCSGVRGHYTQIVWGTTKAVGCASPPIRGREVWACCLSGAIKLIANFHLPLAR